jgi:hypothetical protein
MASRFMKSLALLLTASLGTFACSSAETEDDFADDRCSEEGVLCQGYGRRNYTNKPPAYELGMGTTPPTLTMVFQGQAGTQPVDLEFNPRMTRELWVQSYATSHISIVRNPGMSTQTVAERREAAYQHYMYRPAALSMGGTHPQWGQTFANCGDNNNGGDFHMGPTLYSTKLTLFGSYNNPQTGLGSHLDMLHSTSYCRGIAWAGAGNQYWAFNSYNKSLDFYDFKVDHGPGNTDHSDGVIRRFWNNKLKGVTGVMSGVSWNPDDKKVYVADTGNKRIVVMNPLQGQPVAPLPGNEFIAERMYYEAPLSVLVSGGVLQQPSGIEATGGLVFVTDTATSKIHAFKISDGSLVKSLDTGLVPGSLAGLNFGPEGKIYYVDRRQARVYRIDP